MRGAGKAHGLLHDGEEALVFGGARGKEVLQVVAPVGIIGPGDLDDHVGIEMEQVRLDPEAIVTPGIFVQRVVSTGQE